MAKLTIASGITGVFASVGAAGPEAIKAAAEVLFDEWIRALSTPGKGDVETTYFRTLRRGRGKGRYYVQPIGKRSPPHRASRPGDPPTEDTGELINSIVMREIPGGWRVGSTAWHALWLEYGIGPGYPFKHPASQYTVSGTISRGKNKGQPYSRNVNTGYMVKPRPHLRLAVAKAQPQMNAAAIGALRSAVALDIAEIDLLKIRRGLFSFSATIGNLRALGINLPFLNRLRQGALRLQRGVGDYDAYLSGTLDQRIMNRALGKQAGRLIGDMTRGVPGTFGKRVARRVLSQRVTSPGLAAARRYIKGL